MNTKRVNCAADVILRALTQNRTAAGIATALESAGLLMSPEKAAELAAAPSTVFRASHDSIVIERYTTSSEARKHCEALIRREWPDNNVDWIEDDEDRVAELTVWIGGEECHTGYAVTTLEIASEYDAEADE